MALASNSASAETAAKIKNFNWRPVMDAITQVESKGNAKAKNGPHAGILQISHHVVAEYNKANNTERAIRMWHGGINFSKSKTQQYYNKVKRFLRN